MPKRGKTPPPPEDEPRYLVVVHPYPLNPNLLLHADRRTLALWLACCTGKDALYAMFYKPASPGMVIIEVDRFFDRFDSLLGNHIWASFLKYPTEEEQDKASKIFWCHYNSGRQVQKNGWKRVDVEEHWFQGWSPHNDIIKHPYPKTSYCDVPAEAQTGVPLCRPLPKNTFTPPPPRPRPTVGSAEWVNSRSAKVASEAPSSSRRQRGPGSYASQIAPSDSASMISSPISGIAARGPPPQRALVSQWLAKQRAAEPVWPKAPSTISSSFTLSSSTASSSVGSRTPSGLGAGPAPPPPPGSSVPARPSGSVTAQSPPSLGAYESFDWSEEVEIAIQQDDVPTSPQSGASTSRPPGGRTAPPRRAPEPEGAIDPDRDYPYEEEDLPKRSTADAMKAIFDSAPAVSGLHDLEEEEEADDYLAWNYPQVVGLRTTTRDWTPAGGDEVEPDNPWEGYGAPRWEPPTKVNIKGGEVWICPQHGSTCSPGICKARARVEAMRRWAKEHEEREEAKRQRQEKSRKAAEKKARKNAQAEGREVSNDLPPHFASHRYTGAGGSGSDREDSSSLLSESPAGSESPPPSPPQDGAAGAEDWPENGSLWDDEKNALLTVSLGNRSVTSSNRVEGEDEARSVGGPRTASSSTNPNSGNNSNNNPATPQRPTWAERSAAASERPQSESPGDARGAASRRASSASSWGDDPPATPLSPPGLSQSVRGTRGTANFPTTTNSTRGTSSIFHPVDGGFPTFADTTWGDPIAAAQSARKSSNLTSGTSSPASRSAVGTDVADEQAGGDNGRGNVGAEQDTSGQNDRTARGRRGRRGGRRGTARRTPTTTSPSTSQDAAPSVLNVTLPPGGPGAQWCNDNVEW